MRTQRISVLLFGLLCPLSVGADRGALGAQRVLLSARLCVHRAQRSVADKQRRLLKKIHASEDDLEDLSPYDDAVAAAVDQLRALHTSPLPCTDPSVKALAHCLPESEEGYVVGWPEDPKCERPAMQKFLNPPNPNTATVRIDPAPSPCKGAECPINVVPGGIETTGIIDAKVIRSVMTVGATDFQACYVRENARFPGIKGEIGVTFTVETDGKATNVLTTRNGLSMDARIDSCVADAIRTFHFGNPSSQEKVSYHLGRDDLGARMVIAPLFASFSVVGISRRDCLRGVWCRRPKIGDRLCRGWRRGCAPTLRQLPGIASSGKGAAFPPSVRP